MQSTTMAFSRLVPRLRRYARMISGNQDVGDNLVVETLEALSRVGYHNPEQPDPVNIFQVLSRVWNSKTSSAANPAQPTWSASGPISGPQGITHKSIARQALLLQEIEKFSATEGATILDLKQGVFERLVVNARADSARQTNADVLIIEDELFVASDLEDIVEGMGHKVCATASTRRAAVQVARKTQPTLVLADIALADGSSGIDTVHDILGFLPVPIIFITAYPERLLTGLRPEPTFLIEKPFRAKTVETTISQALYVEQRQVAAA